MHSGTAKEHDLRNTGDLTRVGDSVGAVGRALGVRRDHGGGGSHGLDSGGHRVDGEGGGGRTGSSRLDHGHLTGLLGLSVGRDALAVSWFGS